MKRALIFGGSGFLGEFLCKELGSNGYEVVLADIVSPKYQFDGGFIKVDILDRQQILEINLDFDAVINLAGFANLDDAVKNPHRTIELNVLGNLNILDACVKGNVNRFIYASSAYALSEKGSFYGISKLSSEKLVEEYGKRFDLKYSIVRYGSVYAERDYDNNYIYQLIKNVVQNHRIEHEGDGEEIREYVHAADASRLTRTVIESEEYLNAHVILTGFERLKRIELFEMINEILGGDVEIDLGETHSKHHYQYTPYSFNASFNKKLVANPFIDIGQGILACINQVTEKNDSLSK